MLELTEGGAQGHLHWPADRIIQLAVRIGYATAAHCRFIESGLDHRPCYGSCISYTSVMMYMPL